MKINENITAVITILILTVFSPQFAAAQQADDSLKVAVTGFKDADHDGINDLFCDANGDGVNDVTQQRYRHRFQFEDRNGDGVNDSWVDRDGDGVNDLMVTLLKKRGIEPKTPWIDRNGDGILDPGVMPKFDVDLSEFILDADGDSNNDITGIEISSKRTMGYRYGLIDEETEQEIKKYSDKNDDGMHDNFSNRLQNDIKQYGKIKKFDYFIDEDGDGISDGRGFKRMMRKKAGRGHGKKNGP